MSNLVEMSKRSEPKVRRRTWKWLWTSLVILVLFILIVGNVLFHYARPILKSRIEETLSTRFHSRVELDALDVSILRGVEVSGGGLRVYPPDNIIAGGATQPLIRIEHFHFVAGILGLFIKPTHVRRVDVNGLEIKIPPRSMRSNQSAENRHKTEIKIVVEEIVCDNSRLIIGASNPKKIPKDFELKHIVLYDLGPNKPWKYDAVLTNPVPRGEIHAAGAFGPWRIESVGDSFVGGNYTFRHADLSTIKGIGGVLSSTGTFKGQLNNIVVEGITDTPDFSLATANHPVPLHTEFRAIVDGTTGDTFLPIVKAQLRNSTFTTSGAVVNVKGQGHTVDLAVDVPSAKIQDFLDLAVRTEPAVMTGIIATKAKLHIEAGKESVPRKLALDGRFSVQDIQFTNPKVQDKVDMFSLRAQGEPKKAKPGAKEVRSEMAGTFRMRNGVLSFADLSYAVPGAGVHLGGVYSLDGQQFEFHGKVFTEASISQMVDSPLASVVLKALSPLFKSQTAGAQIPVSIHGTESAPKFGLDVLRDH